MFAASKTDGSSELPDPQFNYVTMLLHGDGTNGGQNNTFLDSSTNNFTITRNGNTTQGSFSPYGSNWGNYFGGTSTASISDYLNVAGNSAFNPLASGDFTIEGWINPLQTQNFSRILCINSTFTTNSVGVNISTSGTYTGKLVFYSFNVANNMLVSDAIIPLNTWTHFAICRSGSSFKMFINGTLQTATYTTASALFNNTSPFMTIGNGDVAVGGFSPFTGYISNLRIVTSALYSSTFTPSTTPLTAVSGTVLLTCQNNRFIDSSASPKTITVGAGTPSVQRFNPFGASTAYSTSVIGGSGYFNGNNDYLATTSNVSIGTGDYTFEWWFYAPTNPSPNYAFFTLGNAASGGSISCYWGSSGTTLYLYPNGYVQLVTIAPSTWNHIAIVRSSGTIKVYLNGLQQGSNISDITNLSGILRLGTFYYNSALDLIKGYMCDFRATTTAVYTTTFTPPTAPLTAVTGTQFLSSMTNGAIFDNAMMNDLETAGNAQISTSVKKYGTGSIDFGNISTDTNFIKVSPSNGFYFTKDFTIEMWVYPYSLDTSHSGGNYAAIVDGDASAGSSFAWFVIHQESQTFYFATNGGSISMQTGNVITSANQWYHLAIVRLNGVLVMYVNGTQQATTSSSNVIGEVGRTIYLGKQPSTGRWFKGAIDDLRVTNGYARYTANFTPPTAAFPNTGPY